mmetsp:Transcript_17418/g.39838  ORF Transcript_17418/g.39838 Transcript_17418/m.39838 type:complete len:323 (-) Transcript_17418:113-1081(-)
MTRRDSWWASHCAHCEQALAEAAIEQTAAALRALGVDVLKVDSCGGLRNLSRWRELLGDDVLIENCFQGGLVPRTLPATAVMSAMRAGDPPVRIAPSNAPCSGSASGERCAYNYYRTSADIRAEWGSVLSNLETVVPFLGDGSTPPRSRPSLWAFPDMLEVGHLASFEEERSHFGAWAVSSSPLTLSFNLSDASTIGRVLPIIANTHLLRVNAAWAGSPGRRLKVVNGDQQTWVKPLGSGEYAVYVLAAGQTTVIADIDCGEVGSELLVANGAQAVLIRDLYDPDGAVIATLRPKASDFRFQTDPIAAHDSRFYSFKLISLQ